MGATSRTAIVALVLTLSLAAGASQDGVAPVAESEPPAARDLYAPALVSQPDTRAQGAVEGMTRVLGIPFLGLRAALVVPGAAAGEIGNGLLTLLDRPAPGTVPHAEPGRLWHGALRSLREDWRESIYLKEKSSEQ